MQSRHLFNVASIANDQGQQLLLKYYMTFKPSCEISSETVYGVGIEKCLAEDTTGIEPEYESVPDIGYSKDEITYLLQKLLEGHATPVSLTELVDDYQSGL